MNYTELTDQVLRKLKVLVAATDELLADAPAMSSYITRKCGEAVDWKVNDAIINGTGAGMPLGVMVAASTVSQAKETSQTATTINASKARMAKVMSHCMRIASRSLPSSMTREVGPMVMAVMS